MNRTAGMHGVGYGDVWGVKMCRIWNAWEEGCVGYGDVGCVALSSEPSALRSEPSALSSELSAISSEPSALSSGPSPLSPQL